MHVDINDPSYNFFYTNSEGIRIRIKPICFHDLNNIMVVAENAFDPEKTYLIHRSKIEIEFVMESQK